MFRKNKKLVAVQTVLDEKLHKKLSKYCTDNEITVKEFVRDLIKKAI